jgi:cellulose synthase/poly-beta-1,6-N-acetylglucosamine synthase-like glycosyltransferase
VHLTAALMSLTDGADHLSVRVSVVVPARNASETVVETLESLTAQTYGDWEAIVVDDGSDGVDSDRGGRPSVAV